MKVFENLRVAIGGALMLALMVFGLMSAPAPTQAATIVQNGSFEDLGGQTLPGNWGILPGLPGWTASSGGVEVQTNPTLGFIDAQDGNNYVELDAASNQSISQNVNLLAGIYELSFYFSPRINQGGSPSTNLINVSIGSLLAGAVDGPSSLVPFGAWTQVVQTFTVTSAGTYSLFFGAGGQSDSLGGLLDNVQISAVPLPAGGLLLLCGLGALAALRRRQRS